MTIPAAYHRLASSATESFMEPIENQCGSLAARDVAEIRLRRDIQKRMAAEIAAAEEDLRVKRRMVHILNHEMTMFIKGVLITQGLDMRHQYRIDEQTGAITLTGVATEEPETMEVPDGG